MFHPSLPLKLCTCLLLPCSLYSVLFDPLSVAVCPVHVIGFSCCIERVRGCGLPLPWYPWVPVVLRWWLVVALVVFFLLLVASEPKGILSRLIQSFLSLSLSRSLLSSTGQGECMSSRRILSCFLDGWSLTRPFLSQVPSFLVLNFVSTIKKGDYMHKCYLWLLWQQNRSILVG